MTEEFRPLVSGLSISSILQTVAGAAILALATWSVNSYAELQAIKATDDNQNRRLEAQSARITSVETRLAEMQLNVIRDVQKSSAEIAVKMDANEKAREGRSDALNTRLDALVEKLGALSTKIDVVSDRVNNYLTTQPPQRYGAPK